MGVCDGAVAAAPACSRPARSRAAALSGSVEERRVCSEPHLHGAYLARPGTNHREENTLVDPAGVASCRAVRVWLSG